VRKPTDHFASAARIDFTSGLLAATAELILGRSAPFSPTNSVRIVARPLKLVEPVVLHARLAGWIDHAKVRRGNASRRRFWCGNRYLSEQARYCLMFIISKYAQSSGPSSLWVWSGPGSIRA
jgi:hypothetical protein